MNKRELELFDKTIHEAKFLLNDIATERKEHKQKIESLMRKHDIKINKMIKKSLKLINDLYELLDDIEEG